MRPLVFCTAVILAGCGASTASTSGPSRGPAGPFDAMAFLLEVGASQTDLLRAPDDGIDVLMARRNDVTGTERRQVLRDLVRAHVVGARSEEGRAARRERDNARRFADTAANGSRDDILNVEMAFIEVWLDYETESRNAASRAERFTTRYERSGDLLVLAWMIRGELALTAEDWSSARDAFRFVLGQLGHPLYAYALYRTGFAWHSAGDEDQARQALEEAAALGCDAGASEPTSRMALLAARQLGVGRRREGERDVPESCPESGAGEEHEVGWRPPE